MSTNWGRARMMDSSGRVVPGQEHAATYNPLLSGAPIFLSQIAPDRTHVFHLYVVQVNNHQQVQESLAARESLRESTTPFPFTSNGPTPILDIIGGDFPMTENAASRILSLPMYAELSPEQRSFVSTALLQSVLRSLEKSV